MRSSRNLRLKRYEPPVGPGRSHTASFSHRTDPRWRPGRVAGRGPVWLGSFWKTPDKGLSGQRKAEREEAQNKEAENKGSQPASADAAGEGGGRPGLRPGAASHRTKRSGTV